MNQSIVYDVKYYPAILVLNFLIAIDGLVGVIWGLFYLIEGLDTQFGMTCLIIGIIMFIIAFALNRAGRYRARAFFEFNGTQVDINLGQGSGFGGPSREIRVDGNVISNGIRWKKSTAPSWTMASGGLQFGSHNTFWGTVYGTSCRDSKGHRVTIALEYGAFSLKSIYAWYDEELIVRNNRVIASDQKFTQAQTATPAQPVAPVQTVAPTSNTTVPTQEVQAAPAAKEASGYTDELRDLKKLLDDGIITKEEFDSKKKQILGL